MRLFVTGTDTDVGKTIVSSWICMHTGAAYWKPIQTGGDSDSGVVQKYSPGTVVLPEAYKLAAPLSPYDAAHQENVEIDPHRLVSNNDCVVIEGAGGCLVPVRNDTYMVDLIAYNKAKAIIVAKSKLGMINHILLSIEAIRNRGCDILGIIINGETDYEIVRTIEQFGGVKVISILPKFNDIKTGLLHTSLPSEIREII